MKAIEIIGARHAFVLTMLFTLQLSGCAEPEDAPDIGSVPGATAFLSTSALPDNERDDLANRLVEQSARIQENEIVLISGSVRDLDLLEDIAVQVRRRGAFPLLSVGSERMTRRMYDDVDPRFDRQSPALDLRLMEMADVLISVDAIETDGLLSHVAPERLVARSEAAAPVVAAMQRRAVRSVNLGNGLYPTSTLAARFEIPQADLARIFWDGVNVDYRALGERGRSIQSALASGRELHITAPGGTDLRVRIEGRPSFVSDGVISDEDRARGSAGSQVWLPAGEIYLAPVAGTAEGTVTIERFDFQGNEVRNLSLTFAGGRLVRMTAESGLEPLRAYYDAAGAGKDELGVIDFGFNPNVRPAPGSRLDAWVSDGMVTVAIGNNIWAGGSNDASFGMAFHVRDGSVTVDGRQILESGEFRL
jgi:aminopeptidase